ncbi:PREDICTED: uncharacterized protein LOC105557032 [Vollenhovia emeryi]|uniref:uncharacterized protein LOC105557032 n=1 Tax=Vollenhovia emeryi TaxID=411798 RepID=UPI0005F39959|nr:PREDICTED: uncharacterized protein LOC105557032 [Vollenhovia emeryi]
MEEWLSRPWARASYRTSQVLTGHGCFGGYLRRIGKEAAACCHHCEEEVDDAQHTLEACPAWAEQRNALRGVVGDDLSLEAIVGRIVHNEEAWNAFSAYCEGVLLRKEEAERIRRGEMNPRDDQGGAGVRGRRRRGRPAHLRRW